MTKGKNMVTVDAPPTTRIQTSPIESPPTVTLNPETKNLLSNKNTNTEQQKNFINEIKSQGTDAQNAVVSGKNPDIKNSLIESAREELEEIANGSGLDNNKIVDTVKPENDFSGLNDNTSANIKLKDSENKPTVVSQAAAATTDEQPQPAPKTQTTETTPQPQPNVEASNPPASPETIENTQQMATDNQENNPVLLTLEEAKILDQVIIQAKNEFCNHKNFLNKQSNTDDIEGLLEVGLAQTQFGASATLEIIEKLQSRKKPLPAEITSLIPKLQQIAKDQEQKLIDLAKKHQLLTNEETNNINSGNKNAFETVMKNVQNDIKNKGINVQGLLRENAIFGPDFKLDLPHILQQAGAWPGDPASQQKIYEQFSTAWEKSSIPLRDKIWEKTKGGSKVALGAGFLVMMMLMQMAGNEGGQQHQ